MLHASIPVRIQQIGALSHDMEPLQEDFRKMQAYHSLLVYLERKAAEEEAQKELEEAEEKSKETRRAKLGLDRFL